MFAYDGSGNRSAAAVARDVSNPGDVTPPPPVANLKATLTPAHHVALSWVTPARAGVRAIVVRRGAAGACPTGPTAGAAVGGRARRPGQVDAAVAQGTTACYRVYAIDAAGTSRSPRHDDRDPRLSSCLRRATRAADGWHRRWCGQSAARRCSCCCLASGAALLVRRRPASAYAPARTGGARAAPVGYSPVALVIPAFVAVALAAVAIFLLNP